MNNKDQQIVRNMIEFIKDTEINIQAAKLGTANREKARAVKEIRAQLEKEIKNADREN